MRYDLKIVDDYIKAIDFYNFQDFCDRLLLTLYPEEYSPVRAGGRNGDMKMMDIAMCLEYFFKLTLPEEKALEQQKIKLKKI